MLSKFFSNKQGSIFPFFIAFIALLTILILLFLPKYRNHQNKVLIRNAFELGKEIAFEEELVKQKTGEYTENFSDLPIQFACTQTKDNIYLCKNFSYQFVEPDAIVVKHLHSGNYFQINISKGEAFCVGAQEESNDFCQAIEEHLNTDL